MRTRITIGRRSDAFTLVELLVATTVTLLLILAVTQAFAIVGQTVSVNRATLEMAGQLRSAGMILQRDFDGLTSPTTPWIQSSWGSGYVEIVDGPANDLDADADLTADVDQPDSVPPIPPINRSLGDLDDVLMYTVRNDDDVFRGRVVINGLQTEQRSNVAEIAVWMGLGDHNQNAVQDPGETNSTMYRRTLLVRPDLNVGGFVRRFPQNVNNSYNVGNQAGLQQMATDLLTFYRLNDISVRFNRVENGNQVELFAIANGLGDLALRQNRFCHDPILYQATLGGNYTYLRRVQVPGHFPYPLNVSATTVGTSSIAAPYYGVLSLVNMVKTSDQLGEDVMLSNVLAFDVRCYDPLVRLVVHRGTDGQWGVAGVDDDGDGTVTDGVDIDEAGWSGSDDECLIPGDLAYEATPANTIKGLGAFVDLNYRAKYGLTAVFGTFFEGTMSNRCRLASGNSGVFDTWPFDYENDGINQDNDLDPFNNPLIDEGTDGIDSDGTLVAVATNRVANGGIDDPAERETMPPYAVPLVGIQVSIRMFDPDTRQIRQVSVVGDFLKE